MNVFISHSSNDKTTAHSVSDSLGNHCTVWLDIRELDPGNVLSTEIQHAIGQSDVFILLWSANSAQSAYVTLEITWAFQLGKPVLMCMLDDTPYATHPLLRDCKGIDFHDRELGIFRLNAWCLKKYLNETQGAVEEVNALRNYEGIVDYVQNHRNKRGQSGEDGFYWANQILQANARSYGSLKALHDKGAENLKFMQSVMDELEKLKHDPAAFDALVRKTLQDPRMQEPMMQGLRQTLEQLQASHPPAARNDASALQDHSQYADHLRQRIEKFVQAEQDLSFLLVAGKLGFAEGISVQELFRNYILKFPDSLLAISRTSLPDHPFNLTERLIQYIEASDDLIPDRGNALWGMLDDAFMVHNTMAFLMQKGMLDATAIVASDLIPLAQFENHIPDLIDPELLAKLWAHWSFLTGFPNPLHAENGDDCTATTKDSLENYLGSQIRYDS